MLRRVAWWIIYLCIAEGAFQGHTSTELSFRCCAGRPAYHWKTHAGASPATARATIASQLFNAREPLGLFELQAWLGHASPKSTQHYVTVTPTKLAGAIERAGYFERNLRTIAVLVDQDAVRSGAAARGEPWRYYDLGHGLCTYDFFDQCPHRMACAKCSFYLPKESAKAQALEAGANLTRMLQEIPLQDAERAAVEDGIEAMEKLVNSLSDTITPDGRTPNAIKKTEWP